MGHGDEALTDGSPGARRLVLNPTSGRGGHAERARRLAAAHGFTVEETSRAGHATDLAEQAATDGVDLLAVCGGDGTVNEVLQGLAAADALAAVTLCIIPAGTENIVASAIGVPSLEAGFEVAERGETRRIDIGTANGEPFLMSAVLGLPADVSEAATHDLKREFGPFAFVIGCVREGLAFDGVRVEVHADPEGEEVTWAGEALAVLVGNVRRFTRGGGQADAEDGLLNVVIVERMPTGEIVAEAIEQQLLHQPSSHVMDLEARRVEVLNLDGSPMTLSLDGEIRELATIRLGVMPGALRLRVGDDYDRHPGHGPGDA